VFLELREIGVYYLIIWLYFWTIRHGLVDEIGQAHLSSPIGTGVRVQSLARTNVICTGGTWRQGKPRGFHDCWYLSQDSQVYKMGQALQITNIWPLRERKSPPLGCNSNVLSQKAKHRVPSLEGTNPQVPLLHVWRFLQVWYPHILQRQFLYECQDFAKDLRIMPRCNVCEKGFVITSCLP